MGSYEAPKLLAISEMLFSANEGTFLARRTLACRERSSCVRVVHTPSSLFHNNIHMRQTDARRSLELLPRMQQSGCSGSEPGPEAHRRMPS